MALGATVAPQPSQLDRESGLGNGSEGYSEGAIGVVLVF